MTRARYGDQRACQLCGANIEFHGSPRRRNDGSVLTDMVVGGWIDRGSNRFCDESGMVRRDENGAKVPFPHVLHKP
jgi:hypothetical protein